MNNIFEKQFLAIVPIKEEKDKIDSVLEIKRFIYKTIVSKPSQELIEKVHQVLKAVNISGIITRGSLANFLFANNIPVPIFDLKFEFTIFLDILQQCSLNGHEKICIFEIGYNNFGVLPENISNHTCIGNYELYYYKMFDTSQIESTITDLIHNKRIDVLIGDVEPVSIASKYNIPTYQIRVDKNSWIETINQAHHSTNIAIKEKSKNNFIKILTNIMSEAVIIIDNAGIIKQFNLQAEKLFFKDFSYHKIQDIFNVSIDTLLSAPANHILKNRDNNYVINSIPVILENEQLFALVINNVSYVQNLEMSIRKQNQERGLTAKTFFKDIIFEDASTKRVIGLAKEYSKSDGTIIIYGESGTGKELLASGIHNESMRSNGPFVAINCAAFNENLIESELFGYEKGAFTGALSSGKKGLFEIAHNGTLFLDEIGELPLNIQAKLLRVIQEKEIIRIGGNKIIPINVRIICATNKNLKRMVKEGLFREDLYYRLALFEIHVPPLRDRPKDIIALFIRFLSEIAEREKKAIYWEGIDTFNSLLDYDWPGNVRELKNFSERVVILSKKNKVTKSFIDSMISEKLSFDSAPTYTAPLTGNLKEFESNYIRFLLGRFGYDKDKLCDYLNISKTTLWRKLNYR